MCLYQVPNCTTKIIIQTSAYSIFLHNGILLSILKGMQCNCMAEAVRPRRYNCIAYLLKQTADSLLFLLHKVIDFHCIQVCIQVCIHIKPVCNDIAYRFASNQLSMQWCCKITMDHCCRLNYHCCRLIFYARKFGFLCYNRIIISLLMFIRVKYTLKCIITQFL